MRIIQTTPSRVGRPAASQPGATRAANVEMLGLLATTVVVLFGVGLAIAGRHGLKPVASIPKEQSVVVAPAVLHDLASPAALVPLLTMIPLLVTGAVGVGVAASSATEPRSTTVPFSWTVSLITALFKARSQ